MVEVEVRYGAEGDLGPLFGGEVAPQHPAIALLVSPGVDRQHLIVADEVDRRELRVHRVTLGHLDGADAGTDLHLVNIVEGFEPLGPV